MQSTTMPVSKVQIFWMAVLSIFGCFILLISLLATNRVSAGHETPLTEGKLYFDGPMLPDHPLYPLLMVRDRVSLWTASEYEAIFLQVRFAEERRQRALVLLKQGQHEMALTTISKSQKYLLFATRQSLALPAESTGHHRDLADILDKSLQHLEYIQDQTPTSNHDLLQHLAEDTRHARTQLLDTLASE